MKKVLLIALFVAGSMIAEAQSSGGVTGKGTTGSGGASRTSATGKRTSGTKVATKHGPHDYTPGSPIGTGGTGDNMSGSRDNSALESSLEKQKQDNGNQQVTQQNDQQTTVRKSSNSKKRVVHKGTRKRAG
jgi:hypothetical protein